MQIQGEKIVTLLDTQVKFRSCFQSRKSVRRWC